MHDVLVIYKQIEMQFGQGGKLLPFEKIPNIPCLMIKTRNPGDSTTGRNRPPIPNTEKNSSNQSDYEYVKIETLSLLTRETIHLVSASHKSSDFATFPKKLDARYPKGDTVRLLLNNHSHIHSERPRKNSRIGLTDTLERSAKSLYPINRSTKWIPLILQKKTLLLSFMKL